jgi:hypothetical protein
MKYLISEIKNQAKTAVAVNCATCIDSPFVNDNVADSRPVM